MDLDGGVNADAYIDIIRVKRVLIVVRVFLP